jgi:isoaspartyl peptidase/L-asparaginase-like protein (Ntn-hydrolase superfamily)
VARLCSAYLFEYPRPFRSNGSVDTAASAVIEQLRAAGGEGGVIAMDARGHVSMPFSSKKMLRGMVSSNGTIEVVTGDQSER